MTDTAFESAVRDAKGVLFEVTYSDVAYPIVNAPNGLLLSELSRVEPDDEGALGLLADFFEQTMGKDTYKRFRRAFYSHGYETVEESVEALGELMRDVVSGTAGRPTK